MTQNTPPNTPKDSSDPTQDFIDQRLANTREEAEDLMRRYPNMSPEEITKAQERDNEAGPSGRNPAADTRMDDKKLKNPYGEYTPMSSLNSDTPSDTEEQKALKELAKGWEDELKQATEKRNTNKGNTRSIEDIISVIDDPTPLDGRERITDPKNATPLADFGQTDSGPESLAALVKEAQTALAPYAQNPVDGAQPSSSATNVPLDSGINERDSDSLTLGMPPLPNVNALPPISEAQEAGETSIGSPSYKESNSFTESLEERRKNTDSSRGR